MNTFYPQLFIDQVHNTPSGDGGEGASADATESDFFDSHTDESNDTSSSAADAGSALSSSSNASSVSQKPVVAVPAASTKPKSVSAVGVFLALFITLSNALDFSFRNL